MTFIPRLKIKTILLQIICNLGFPWKTLLNPGTSKQAMEVCFTHRHEKKNYPPFVFGS